MNKDRSEQGSRSGERGGFQLGQSRGDEMGPSCEVDKEGARQWASKSILYMGAD